MSRDPEKVNIPPPGLPPDPVARALAALEPAPARLNRDRLMFQAGAESRRTVIRLWQATAGFLAAMGFAAGMYCRGPSVVYIEREPTSQVSPAMSLGSPQAGAAASPGVSAGTNDGVPATPEDPSSAPDRNQTLPPTEPPLDLIGWLELRNDVLSGGLGVLPDRGRQLPPRTRVGIGQPGRLPRQADAVPK